MRYEFNGPEFLYNWLMEPENGLITKSIADISNRSATWQPVISSKQNNSFYIEMNSSNHYDAGFRTNNNGDMSPIASGNIIFNELETEECKIYTLSQVGRNPKYAIIHSDDWEIQITNNIPTDGTKYSVMYKGSISHNTNLQTYITTAKALGAGIADKYAAQPIVLGGVKTPLYSIVSNSTSVDPDLFTEVAVDGQKFFVVDHGVGVKVE